MKITVSGTQAELVQFFKAFKVDAQKFKQLVESGLVEKEVSIDDEEIYKVLNEVSWESIWLAELIMEHGTDEGQIDSQGIYLTPKQIQEIGGIDERAASARVGGFKKVGSRLEVETDILFIKFKKGEKRYYLYDEAISTLKQFIENSEEDYREHLEDNEIPDPRV
jgi:hypothetical protein